MTRPSNRTESTPSANAPPGSEVIFLGTGTSVGVPSLGCECAVCTSDDPRNNRTRCAIVVRLPEGNLLVDTPPDLRTQLLREKISLVHAVLFTHEHVDHLYGLDDLRLFPFRLGHAVPLYCEHHVETRIRMVYDYAFSDRVPTHPGSAPQLSFEQITHDSFEVLGVEVTPIPMQHGPHFNVLGFRIGGFAYCTDTNHIPADSIERLRGVDTLVIDALRFKSHPTHFNVEEALEVINEIQPRAAYLTHICHDLDHGIVEPQLPDNVYLAYDGLRLPLPQ
ncbi:MBL fold metallo-hydrolase [Rhodopirellula sp. SWK7]|uniref:MBL fold metallo-hydrolase n=1 Tax=Rhodopirellula sp. SWK7 TaxID=595460 RepID=UPI0002BD6AB9|nr:MBL fold metallo-hydrolase [Rhodopirellula sp. SWK7]EMI42768.1 metallo-beta-lactamase family protein [Rhodopirellula sp. SWK7]